MTCPPGKCEAERHIAAVAFMERQLKEAMQRNAELKQRLANLNQTPKISERVPSPRQTTTADERSTET